MLRTSAADNQHDWDLCLPTVMLSYRWSTHETTVATPFMLAFGRDIQLPMDVIFGTPHTITAPQSAAEHTQTLQDRLHAAYDLVPTRMKAKRRHQSNCTTVVLQVFLSKSRIGFGCIAQWFPVENPANYIARVRAHFEW